MFVLVVLNFHAETLLSKSSSISSRVRPFSSGRQRKKKMPQAKFDPAQIYPYFAPYTCCQIIIKFMVERVGAQECYTTYPVHILGVDKVRRAEASEPGKKVSETDRRAHCPRPQPCAYQLGCNRVARGSDKCVVGEHVQRGEGDEAISCGESASRCRRCDGDDQHTQTLR